MPVVPADSFSSPSPPIPADPQSANTANEPQVMSIGSAPLANDTAAAHNSLFGIDMPFDVISAGFAALVATGGVIGFAKAGSIPSLAAGLTFGGILGIGAYLTSVNPANYYLTAGTSAVLGSFMGYRFYNSGKFMPAGLICLLSIGMVARYSIIAITNDKQQRAQ